jgi:hypothetical protein
MKANQSRTERLIETDPPSDGLWGGGDNRRIRAGRDRPWCPVGCFLPFTCLVPQPNPLPRRWRWHAGADLSITQPSSSVPCPSILMLLDRPVHHCIPIPELSVNPIPIAFQSPLPGLLPFLIRLLRRSLRCCLGEIPSGPQALWRALPGLDVVLVDREVVKHSGLFRPED